MAITFQQNSTHAVTISVAGQFDHSIKTELQEGIASLGDMMRYCFDFGRTSKLHSTGVGLLIDIRQQLGGARANISLQNCSEEIMRVLKQAGLLPLFTVQTAFV